MKLENIYLEHEKRASEILFKKIELAFRKDKKTFYLDKSGTKKDDEYLELLNYSSGSETIKFKRRNGEEWTVKFPLLKDAIKFTLRQGSIQRPTDYLHMDGVSNFVGTPLHLLISLLNNEDYQEYSLVGRLLPHNKFGVVQIIKLEYTRNDIYILSENNQKQIKMDFWETTEKDFNHAFDKR